MTPACKDIAELLSPWLDGELDDAGRDAVAAHLAECPACAALFEKTRRMDALYAAIPRAAAPEDFEDRVRAAIAAGTFAAFPRKTRVQRFWPLLMAAAIIVAFTLYFRLPTSQNKYAPELMELSKLEAPAAAPLGEKEGAPAAEMSGGGGGKPEAASAVSQENMHYYAKPLSEEDQQHLENLTPLYSTSSSEEKPSKSADDALRLALPEPEESLKRKALPEPAEIRQEKTLEAPAQHIAARAAGEAQSPSAQAPAEPLASPASTTALDSDAPAPAPAPPPVPAIVAAIPSEAAAPKPYLAEKKGSLGAIGVEAPSSPAPPQPEAASGRALSSDGLEDNSSTIEASSITGGEYRPESFGYDARLGLKAYLVATRVEPSPAAAGALIRITVSYALFGAPNDIDVEEIRSLYKDGKKIAGLAAGKGSRQNGLWRSTQPAQLPTGLAPGNYTVVTEAFHENQRLISASAEVAIE